LFRQSTSRGGKKTSNKKEEKKLAAKEPCCPLGKRGGGPWRAAKESEREQYRNPGGRGILFWGASEKRAGTREKKMGGGIRTG